MKFYKERLESNCIVGRIFGIVVIRKSVPLATVEFNADYLRWKRYIDGGNYKKVRVLEDQILALVEEAAVKKEKFIKMFVSKTDYDLMQEWWECNVDYKPFPLMFAGVELISEEK